MRKSPYKLTINDLILRTNGPISIGLCMIPVISQFDLVLASLGLPKLNKISVSNNDAGESGNQTMHFLFL